MTSTLTDWTFSWPSEAEEVDPSTTIAGLPGHFCLHYQPHLDLVTGAILRAEALLRWWHPEFGLLRPHVSLRGTRWADDLCGLDGWVAAEACRQGARWDLDGLPVQIDLNVSTTTLLRSGFVASVLRELDRSGLSSHRLAIDIPFAALATHPVAVDRISRALAEAGVGVVVDGLRPGSLAGISATAWKIEPSRATRRRPGLHPSVALAVERAHDAGALAIAKAVEDQGQLADVRAAGFDGAFGHAVSRPVSVDAARTTFRTASRTGSLFAG